MVYLNDLGTLTETTATAFRQGDQKPSCLKGWGRNDCAQSSWQHFSVAILPDKTGNTYGNLQFCRWDLNGVRQQDGFGAALSGFTFPLNVSTTVRVGTPLSDTPYSATPSARCIRFPWAMRATCPILFT